MERLVVITGLSGSGKSLAANCLEDLGYFCVDNLPVNLIYPFCELIQRSGTQFPLSALVIDARERTALERFPTILDKLRHRKLPLEVLFFDASDEILMRRFSESRRPHPMARLQPTLDEAIAAERKAVLPLRERADRIIDTSNFTAHQLRNFLQSSFGTAPASRVPNVNVISFGFKYGIPSEADLVFDVRFLPNPYFIESLRSLNGRDAPVREFVNNLELSQQFMQHLQDLLDFLIPQYSAEGKSYLTVAIGCTGGKHRSVALSERLGGYLEGRELPVTVSHRDLGRE